MTYSYDLSTDIGLVRLRVPDNDPDKFVFTDEEIAAFLRMESDDVTCASALALETIASNTALTLKVVRAMDITTDGSKTAETLMKRAADMRQQVANNDSGFVIAPFVVNKFGRREQILNDWGVVDL